MLQLDLGVDLDAATAFLSNLSRRHIPFAAARALSAVAAESRDAVEQTCRIVSLCAGQRLAAREVDCPGNRF